MATTTTNYGWDIPQSTDLVKDGATAIATLGQDIDTSVYTALAGKKSGLVLLNTTSFSAVASQSVNDVFSATYANYKVIANFTASSGNATTLRFRTAGSDNSTTNYIYANLLNQSNATSTAQGGTAASSISMGGNSTAGDNFSIIFDILNPFASIKTHLSYIGGADNAAHKAGFAVFNATTSFDGFTIIGNTGTITGSVKIYGYN